jgi:DNA-binding MarR family transcriptional regulator
VALADPYADRVKQEQAAQFRKQLTALQRRLRQEMKPGPVPTSDALVLGAIARRGPTNPGDLAEELFMATSNVAATLRTLEAAGLITRRRDKADARRVLIELTEPGRQLVRDDRKTRDLWLCQAVDAALNADEQELLRRAGELMERLAYFGAP